MTISCLLFRIVRHEVQQDKMQEQMQDYEKGIEEKGHGEMLLATHDGGDLGRTSMLENRSELCDSVH